MPNNAGESTDSRQKEKSKIYVGARKSPDGSWDYSKALVMEDPEGKIAERIKKHTEQENNSMRENESQETLLNERLEKKDDRIIEDVGLIEFDEEYFHSISAGDKYDWIAFGMENCKNQRYYTVVGRDNVKLGIVGIYDTDDDQNIAHIIIDSKFRGKNLLLKFYNALLERENLSFLTATINIDNIASVRSHEKAGFKKISDKEYEEEFHKYKYRFITK